MRGSCQEVESTVFLLAENAARYSGSRIYLRSGQVNETSYLFIHNDVAGDAAKGNRAGLGIDERLGRRNGLKLQSRDREGSYSLLIVSRRN